MPRDENLRCDMWRSMIPPLSTDFLRRKEYLPGLPFLVGVTGAMACGKSAVCRSLAALLSCGWLDLDAICRMLLEPEHEGWRALTRDRNVPMRPDGTNIDRSRLKEMLFADGVFRQQIEDVLHPLVLKEMRRQTDGYIHSTLLIVEVPLLFEVRWQVEFHCIVSIYCGRQESVRRLGRRDHMEISEAENTLAAQLPAEAKALAADHVVDNSGPWAATMLEIPRLARILKEKSVDKPGAGP